MRTYEINKISLSYFGGKRSVLNDGIHMLAYFHKDLKNRLTQMIINKKDSKRFLQIKERFSHMITNENRYMQINSQ